MSDQNSKVQADRALLNGALEQGGVAPFKAYLRLSGPGWLQSAITLGGGSLAGSLFLGVLGGPKLLWLQLVAIVMGVIMLSAISYVTLSTGKKPFQAINQHINPVLGWGWLIATVMANMIWSMPQFGLCYAALQKNLIGESVGDSTGNKLIISGVILAITFVVVLMNRKQGVGVKLFDLFLKALVGMIVICFFGVVVVMWFAGELDWSNILGGLIPDFGQATRPTGAVAGLVDSMPENIGEFWSSLVVKEQRAVMIGAAATAVGINMTFLLPYSMLNRGWDKPFRGLARFDLCTGMAIPFVLVTSCVVIAAAGSFHAVIDDSLKSTDPTTFSQSELFKGVQPLLAKRLTHEQGESFAGLSSEAQLTAMAALPESEKRVAVSLVRRNAFQLSKSLAPLLGEKTANLIFGFGIFGMGFSTIIILMLINGFAFCEMTGQEQGGSMFTIGCLVAGVSGAAWPLIWDGPAKLWLAILTSSFGMMLLPIAYITFFMMMNSSTLMGEEKPRGGKLFIWNLLMGISVIGAVVAAATAIIDKAGHPIAGKVVVGVGVVYAVLVVLGFVLKKK